MDDLIRRADAIDTLRGMFDMRKKRAKELVEWFTELIETVPSAEYSKPLQTTLNGDLISRADAIRAVAEHFSFDDGCSNIYKNMDYYKGIAEHILKNVPSSLPSAEAMTQSEQYKKGFEDAKRAFELEFAREAENIRKRNAELEVMLNAQKAISADAEDRLYIKIYADDEPSVKAEKLYQICGETQNREVTEWLKEYFPSAEAEWIPCSERLPETHTEYVTENPWTQVSITEDTYQLSEPVLGYGKRKYHGDDDPMMAVVWYEDDGYGRTAWITAPDCGDIDVLAWMPLPKPYKGGDTE